MKSSKKYLDWESPSGYFVCETPSPVIGKKRNDISIDTGTYFILIESGTLLTISDNKTNKIIANINLDKLSEKKKYGK